MCNGIKVPFEQRILQKTPQRFMESFKNSNPKNGNEQKNNSNILNPIQENQNGFINHQALQKPQEMFNKSPLSQNNISPAQKQTPIKEGIYLNNSIQNQSILKQGSTKSKEKFQLNESTILNGNSNPTSKSEQSLDQKKSISFNQDKSIILPNNNESSLSNKSLLNQQNKQIGDQQKENSYHILINDGESCSQTNLTQQLSIEELKYLKNSTIKIKSNNSPICLTEREKNQIINQTNKNNSPFLPEQGIFSQSNQIQAKISKLNQSFNYSGDKNLNRGQQNNQKNEDLSQSPTRSPLNLSYRIRSPKLNHSPLKKSPLNYTMTVQNLKVQRDNLASASQFEILNTQFSPLKDINNENEIQYGSSLKYIINLLRKEDPQILQTLQITQQNIQKSDKKSQKSPVKRK